MALTRLYCQNLRSIDSADLQPDPAVNIFYGANGAGKTSLLEAIHILSTGRSFRSPQIKNIIQREKDYLLVTGATVENENQQQIGIQKWKDQVKARINQQQVKHIATLSSALPVIAFHPGSSRLITEDPGERRAYIDWGVFQLQPDFLKHWRLYRHILKQRNAAIRTHKGISDISIWDQQLSRSAEFIHHIRSEYVTQILDGLPGLTQKFTLPYQIDVKYKPGWDTAKDFQTVLSSHIERDRSLGYTYAGPHRADLNILLDGQTAATVASRGQLKLITIILKILQATLFKLKTDRKAILLLDDLPSEFDQQHLNESCSILKDLNTQLFITMVEENRGLFDDLQSKLFHVEHGSVSAA